MMTLARLSDASSEPIREAHQLRVLNSTMRNEIFDSVSAGRCTVAELAYQLGRPADALYFHIRKLLQAGLIKEVGRSKTNGRDGALYGLATDRRIGYDPRDPVNVRLVTAMVAAILRVALRDFKSGFDQRVAVVTGTRRNLWAGRGNTWLTPTELEEVNDLIQQVRHYLNRPRREGTSLHAFSWVLAPVERREPLAPTPAKQAPVPPAQGRKPCDT